jgi:hypothetical protein
VLFRTSPAGTYRIPPAGRNSRLWRNTVKRVAVVAALAAVTSTVAGTAMAEADGSAASPDPGPNSVATGLLLAHYNFNGCNVADSSGNGLDGAVEGTLGCSPGVEGQAFAFDGGGYASVNAASLGATSRQPRTISLWINPSFVPLDPGNSGLISKYFHFDVGQSNYYASLYQRPDGQIVTRLTGNGTDVIDAPAGTLNEWQHYAFVIAAGTGNSRIYRNGVLVASGTLSLNDALTSQPLRIGNIAGADDQVFRGTLDDVRIFKQVLTEGQIRQLARR